MSDDAIQYEAPQPVVRKDRQDIALCNSLVSAEGVPKFALDERTIWSRRSFKGYHVILGWVMDPATSKPEAAMTLVPEILPADPGAWVITRRGIMEFSDEHNKPTKRCFESCMAALPILGYDTIKAELYRLVDTVMSAVDDLVLMPPCPINVRLIMQGDPIWDVTVHKVGEPGKVIRESTI